MNLYVHFPFCRRKCAYCALFSRAGAPAAVREAYVRRLADEIRALAPAPAAPHTVYFGGGTPALCDLAPLFAALRDAGLVPAAEFTVELHPADVTPDLPEALARGGVNRLSLGVQSFDDGVLRALGRGHTAAEARQAFVRMKRSCANAGLDLIAGLPGRDGAAAFRRSVLAALELEPQHVSVYALIREPGTLLDRWVREARWILPDDDQALDDLAWADDALQRAGFARYEIANWARENRSCRHNAAVWRGEDYVGLGDGAHGREGLGRTVGEKGTYRRETVSAETDALEREIISLRTSAGFDPDRAARRRPVLAPRLAAWRAALAFSCEQGLTTCEKGTYVLTRRGREVCDAVMADLL